MREVDLTESDRRILRLIQRDARATTADVAEASGLSASPAWRRLKRLEDLGVIRAHVTLLDPQKLNLSARAFIEVSLADHKEETVNRFDALVQSEPQIVDCARIAGDFDYLLHVITRDTESLESFLLRRLQTSGLTRKVRTNFVLRMTKSTTALPLD